MPTKRINYKRASKALGEHIDKYNASLGAFVSAFDMGNTRTTAFCRRWYGGLDRFGGVNDPDYEYED